MRPSDARHARVAQVLQSVKNWFNPTGHGANKAWLARQKDGGGADAGAALLAAVATRHRRKEERRAAPGDRVRVLQAGGDWARGVVAPLAPTEAPAEGAGAAAGSGSPILARLAAGSFVSVKNSRAIATGPRMSAAPPCGKALGGPHATIWYCLPSSSLGASSRIVP